MKHSTHYYFGTERSHNNRLESLAFSGLAVAGMALIGVALINSVDFAERRESVTEAWSTAGQAGGELAGRAPDPVRTNVVRVEVAPGPKVLGTSPGRMVLPRERSSGEALPGGQRSGHARIETRGRGLSRGVAPAHGDLI